MAKRRKSTKSVVSSLCKQDNCCPVLRVTCRTTSSPQKVTETFTRGDGKKITARYTKKGETRTVCSLRAGTRVVGKDLTGQQLAKQIGILKKSLEGRRCRVEIQRPEKKPAATT